MPALLVALLFAASPPAPGQLVSRTWNRAMGPVTVTLVVRPDVNPEPAFEAVQREFDRVEAVMNEWREDSPLSAINRAAGDGQWVRIPLDLCQLLEDSRRAARWTGGLFDPTWASVRDLWRFGDGDPKVVPPASEVERRCAAVDHRALELKAKGAGCQARLRRAGTQLGLGGVAKGYAVDRAVQVLRSRGFTDFWVQAGGDLYAAGKRGAAPWVVGLRDPRGPADQAFAVLEVSDAAFSTTGDYERFFEVDGVRYHHVIDPRTCMPARKSRSASVLAKTATEAEYLTKAVFILGGAEGLALARRHNAEAVVVGADNTLHVSGALEGKLRWQPPTP